jgi:hypothetical protein
MQGAEVSEEFLEDLYTWIDEVPLSRPKKDMKRDFSDGGRRKIVEVSCAFYRYVS